MNNPVLGREYEFGQIRDALERSKTARVPAAICVAGQSGIGKSTLLEGAGASASSTGWLRVFARCHEIQARLPLAGAQRLADSILKALGADRERYAAETLCASLRERRDGFEDAFLRLVEGVSLDFPLLVLIDDAQWLDGESCTLIRNAARAFLDRPIALLVAERTGLGVGPIQWLASDLTVAIGALPKSVAAEIARTHYPQATSALVDAIVEQSMAHPIDLVTLAQAAREQEIVEPGDLTASVRTVVARRLDAMPPEVREFLQICALISEPIPFGTLSKIWLDESRLLALIQTVSGRYLIEDREGLRFAHASISESIRETMPIEIPYRRRVLAALLSIEQPSLYDSQSIVEQAGACGDSNLEYDYLLRIGEESAAKGIFAGASEAYQRALHIRAPSRATVVRFYSKYALALFNQARFAESATLLRRALRESTSQEIEGAVGTLGLQLIASVLSTEGVEAAIETYKHYLKLARDENERVLLHSIASFFFVSRCDEEQFKVLKEAVLSCPGGAPADAAARVIMCEALLHSRLGDYPEALRSLERAELAAEGVSSPQRMTAEYSRGLVDFLHLGAGTRAVAAAGGDPLDPIRVMTLFGTGDWSDARSFVRSALAGGRQTVVRPQLLAVDAAIGVLTNGALAHDTEIVTEVRRLERGAFQDALVPLAAWWAAALALQQKSDAAGLLDNVMSLVASPLSPFTLLVPLSLVVAAHRLGDRGKLERLAEMSGVWCDRNPWNIAQRDLAMGVASTLLARARSQETLEAAARSFDKLGAPFFAAYARGSSGRGADGALALLGALGVTQVLGATPAVAKKVAAGAGGPLRPTARERQVAALVAEGKTNREIAENLVLSERTVEAHLSNLFNKVGVSSRTQLAAWYYAN
ncbi:MAG: LuxR C-terminal-related transcriptional regulator [Candidatus Baltobacteraceae bacterium]